MSRNGRSPWVVLDQGAEMTLEAPGAVRPQGWRVWPRVALLAILAVAALLRFYGITRLGLTIWDEGLYAAAGRLLTFQGFQGFPALRTIAAPPLFSILVGLSQGLFGRTDWPGIAVSAAAGTLTVYLMYLFGKKVYGLEAGLLSALFVAVSPYHVIYSRMGLTETTFLLFALLTLFFFTQALDEEGLRAYVLAGIAAGLMLNTKYSGPLVLAPCLLVGVWHLVTSRLKVRRPISEQGLEEGPSRGRSTVVVLSLFSLTVAALSLPWVFFLAVRWGYSKLLTVPFGYTALAGGGLISTPPPLILAYFLRWTSPAFLVLALLGALGALMRRKAADGLLLTYLLIYSLGVMIYLSYDRLALPLLPALALFAGNGVKVLFKGSRRKMFKVAILGVALLVAFDLLQSSMPLLSVKADGYRSAARFVEALPGEVSVFEKTQLNFRFYTFRPFHLADHPEIRRALVQEGTKYFIVDQTLTWAAFPKKLFEQNRDRLKLLAKLPNPTYEIVYLQPASLEKMKRLENGDIPDEYRYIFVYRTDQPLVLP